MKENNNNAVVTEELYGKYITLFKFDWESIAKRPLPEDFIRKFEDSLNWFIISE